MTVARWRLQYIAEITVGSAVRQEERLTQAKLLHARDELGVPRGSR